MAKNILYIPQFSMSDGKTLYIDKDGNFLVLKTIIKHLNRFIREENINEIINLNIVMPGLDIVYETCFFDELADLDNLENLNIKHVPINGYHISPIVNRYDFRFNEISHEITKADAIFNNIPEITRNFRAILGNKKIPIISFHHFCDYIQENKLVTSWENGNLFSYFWRQLDGYLSSDYNVFNCQESLTGWEEAVKYAVTYELHKNFKTKDTYIHYTDLDEYAFNYRYQKFATPTVVYNSRITKSMYTNWTKVIDLFSGIEKPIPRCIMTNPSGEKGIDAINSEFGLDFLESFHESILFAGESEIKVLVSPDYKLLIVNENLPREKYIDILRSSHFALNLYFNERYGGIAIREAISYGQAFPIVPDIYSFSKWLITPKELKFNNLDQLTVDLINQIVLKSDQYKHNVLDLFYASEHYSEYYHNFKSVLKGVFSNE